MLDLIPSAMTAGYSPGGIRIIDMVTGTKPVIEPMLINEYSTLTIPAYWRAINFIAENLASFPRVVTDDDGEPDRKHPVSRLLRRRPNVYQNAFTFWRTLFFHTAHHGNGYARIQRESYYGFAIRAMHNVPPEDCWPFRYDRLDGRGPMQFYLHRPTRTVLASSDVIHLAALSHDGMKGIDSIALHTGTFQRAATLGKFQTKFLQQGTVIRGAIEIPTGVSKETLLEIQNTLKMYFRGADAERDVITLSDGATLKNVTLTPQQSQIVEQGAYSTKQISQITGVPPEFLYEFAESKYNNNLEQMGQNVVRYTFRPWIQQVEEELTMKLLADDEQDAKGLSVRLNPNALLRGDTQTQTDTLVSTVQAGVRTPNEARSHLGEPKLDDPEADALKRTGDTTPQVGAKGVARPPAALPAPASGADADPQASAAPAKTSVVNTEVNAESSLNGAQITAAVEVLGKIATGELVEVAAVELLVAVGIPRERADAMVKAQKSGAKPPGDAAPPPASANRTVGEAASATGLSKSRISKLASAGKIVSNGKTGPERRVDVASIMEWIAKRDKDDEDETDDEVEQKFREAEDE